MHKQVGSDFLVNLVDMDFNDETSPHNKVLSFIPTPSVTHLQMKAEHKVFWTIRLKYFYLFIYFLNMDRANLPLTTDNLDMDL